jgi:hypothetical protein
MTQRIDTVEEILDGVGEMRAQWLKDWEEGLKGLPYGAQNMNDEQHVAWFAEMQKRYPPEPWITPDGQVVEVSPWLLALRYVEDGPKELRRYSKTMLEHTLGALSAASNG